MLLNLFFFYQRLPFSWRMYCNNNKKKVYILKILFVRHQYYSAKKKAKYIFKGLYEYLYNFFCELSI